MLAALLLVAVASPCPAGVLRGVVRVPAAPVRPAAVTSAYGGRAGALPGAHRPERGSVADAVLYIERLSAGADSALEMPGRSALAQEGQAFVPRVIAVPVGGLVDFPNHDPIFHNVFSLSPPRRFDLGKYPRGQSRTVRFDRPGLVNVYCDIHSNMEAFILVVPNRAFARPGPDGAFALPPLPAGRYVLRAWHPDLPEQVLTVDVPATGDVSVAVGF
jgi:plastocyanin